MEEQTASSEPLAGKRVLVVLRAGFIVLGLAGAAGVLFPHSRTWGVHFLAYFPPSVQIALAGCALLLAVLSLVPEAGLRLAERLPAASLHPVLADAVAAFICAAGFYVLSAATPLLGDGQLWVDNLFRDDSILLVERGPLTPMVVKLFYHALSPVIPLDAAGVFRLTSVLAGAVAVFAWLRYARAAGVSRTAALLWGFAWGGVALFFGYIELYSIMAAVISTTLALMLISARRGHFTPWVLLPGLAAVAFHYAAVAFLPAVVAYAIWGITRRPLKAGPVFLSAAALFTAAGAAYFALGWQRGSDTLLALWPPALSAGGYALQARHFADMANGLILCAGAFTVLLAAYWIGQRGRIRWHNEGLLLTLALIFPLAAYFMHNSSLGMARDWDIPATLLLAVPFASIALWSEVRTLIQPRAGLSLVAAWILVVTVPWIALQASQRLSMTRFADLLRLDPERSANGWDYLGSYYRLRNDLEAWADCYREALKHEDNPRYHTNLALYYLWNRRWDEGAEHIFRARDTIFADSVLTSWEIQVLDTRKFLELGRTFEELTGAEDARQIYWLASQLDPNSPLPPVAMARMVVRMRELGRAEEMYRMIFARDPLQLTEAKRYYVGLVQQRGRLEQIEGYCGLAVVAHLEGNLPHTAENLQQALSRAEGDDKIAAYLASLQSSTREPGGR